MSRDIHASENVLKYDVEVPENGLIQLPVPFLPGSKVAVIVIEEPDRANDLMTAAQSSLDFWDNPYDDEDWNNG